MYGNENEYKNDNINISLDTVFKRSIYINKLMNDCTILRYDGNSFPLYYIVRNELINRNESGIHVFGSYNREFSDVTDDERDIILSSYQEAIEGMSKDSHIGFSNDMIFRFPESSFKSFYVCEIEWPDESYDVDECLYELEEEFLRQLIRTR